MEDFLKKAGDVLLSSGLKLLLACLVLFVGFKFVKFLLARISKRHGFQRIDPSAQTFIKSFLNIAAKILIVITAAAIMGVPMTSITAAIASAALAIGLALQGGLSNLAGGVLLLVFKPFTIGDYIKTEGGFEGTVVKIDIFYTTLRTSDNTKVVVPNGTLSNEAISDVSHYGTRRVELKFSAGYQNDVDQVIALLKETAARHSLVINDPAPPFAALAAHGDNALNYVLRVWCRQEDYWTVYYDLCAEIKREFDRNGIEIPYPQLDVHVKDSSGK